MTSLPKEFVIRMHKQLGAEADDFLESYQQEKVYGLRLNPLKPTCSLPFTLTPVPWSGEGFYALKEERPGRHPLHEAGAYYIQEPSTMAVVSLLEPRPGDRICDLCAAPGGKTTDIAGKMEGRGILISNEIISSRARVLSQNVERLGITNALVTNEAPDKLAEYFPLFFDKMVVDAPCSGEGMFRKDDTAIQEWSLEQVEVCRERQRMILGCADQMLAPGGVLVYSTCTFAPEEDEDMIGWFLSAHPDYVIEDWRSILPEGCGLEGGRREYLLSEYQEEIGVQIKNTLRLWPHKLKGEGHFAARLRKVGCSGGKTALESKVLSGRRGGNHKSGKAKETCRKTKRSIAELEDYRDFCAQFLQPLSVIKEKVPGIEENYQYFGDELYVLPSQAPKLSALRVLRAGLHLGSRKKNRFEPVHSLAMALSPGDVIQYQDCDEALALRYLHGETIPCGTNLHSWTLVTCHGVSMGWGKAQNGVLKNHYPKGLRIQGDIR